MTISQSHTKGPFAIIVIITRWPVSLQLCMPVYCKCVCWLLWFAAVTHMNEFISWCLVQWLINFVYWLQCSVHRLSDLANWFPTQWLNKNCWLLNVSCVFCVESDCTPGCPIWQVDLCSISSNFTSDLIVKNKQSVTVSVCMLVWFMSHQYDTSLIQRVSFYTEVL